MSTQERHLAAILFTDIVGYTAMMQKDEAKAVNVIKHYNGVLDNSVKTHRGEILNNYGDGSLCSFSSALDALTCAIEIQSKLQSEPVVPLRVGLHVGEIFFENGKVLGDGVNIASRIQSLGVANSILLSEEIHSKIKNHPEYKTTALGTFQFKNVDDKIDVFALKNDGLIVPDKSKMEGKLAANENPIKIWMMVVGLSLLMIVGYLIYQRFDAGDNVLDKSIAVLPFVNMSDDPAQEYFSDGLTEELINILANIPELKVIARTSAFAFKGKNEDLRVIGETLGVSYILEGSIRKSGRRIRVTSQLIKVADGSHLWSKSSERELTDIFKIQDEIAQDVVNNFNLTLLETTNVPRELNSKDAEVYSLILQGRYLYRLRTQESFDEAIEKYEKALKINPNEARALAGLSDVYTAATGYGFFQINEGNQKAKKYAEEAIISNKNLPEAYTALAWVNLMYEWKWRDAERNYSLALNLDPRNVNALNGLGALSVILGKLDSAFSLFERVIEIDPLRLGAISNLGYAYLFANKAVEAETTYRRLLKLNPKAATAYYFLCLSLLEVDKPNLALEEIEREALDPYKIHGTAIINYYLKNNLRGDSLLRKYVADYGNDGWWFQTAELFAYKGDVDSSFKWLELAYKNKDGGLTGILNDPLLENIKQDSRYAVLLRKLDLPNVK